MNKHDKRILAESVAHHRVETEILINEILEIHKEDIKLMKEEEEKELLKHLPMFPHKLGGKKFNRKELKSLVEYFRKHLEKNEKEKCVYCNSITPYKKSDDISIRDYYVEGAGQLCITCFFETYGSI